jgi:energy-coupling factor transporter transmembrane protein EcfT
LLFLSTTVLALTTPAADIASGLERLLAPLRRVGVRSDRIARSLALSWSYFPLFWQHARREFGPDSGRSRERKGWLNRIIHLPGDLVADLYRLAEQTAAG